MSMLEHWIMDQLHVRAGNLGLELVQTTEAEIEIIFEKLSEMLA